MTLIHSGLANTDPAAINNVNKLGRGSKLLAMWFLTSFFFKFM